ncbi:MAG: collagen-like protein, partial [Clostridia bacterium]|nr:collagen-like protein [Clostridia bacterium]
PAGPTGATGATGPQGPIGPAGPQGSADSIFASSGASTIEAGVTAPLTLTTATPDSSMSVSANAVTLTEDGYYLVSFFLTGNNASSYSLENNGTTVATLSDTSAGTDTTTQSQTVLINASAGDTLTLVNTGTDSIAVTSTGITVLKVA